MAMTLRNIRGKQMSPCSACSHVADCVLSDIEALGERPRWFVAGADGAHSRIRKLGFVLPRAERLSLLCDHIRRVVNVRADKQMPRIDACRCIATVTDDFTSAKLTPVRALPSEPTSDEREAAYTDTPVSAVPAATCPKQARAILNSVRGEDFVDGRALRSMPFDHFLPKHDTAAFFGAESRT